MICLCVDSTARYTPRLQTCTLLYLVFSLSDLYKTVKDGYRPRINNPYQPKLSRNHSGGKPFANGALSWPHPCGTVRCHCKVVHRLGKSTVPASPRPGTALPERNGRDTVAPCNALVSSRRTDKSIHQPESIPSWGTIYRPYERSTRHRPGAVRCVTMAGNHRNTVWLPRRWRTTWIPSALGLGSHHRNNHQRPLM